MRLRCPECGSRAGIRTSRKISLTITEVYFDCSSRECGCRFKVLAEVIGVIIRGDVPNPLITLPVLKAKATAQ